MKYGVPYMDLSGKTIKMFKVLCLSSNRGNKGQLLWTCKCIECGVTVERSGQTLRTGAVKCDCLKLTRHPLYSAWSAMLSRCYNKGNTSYPDYGGRGITVCDRWLAFTDFAKDVGVRPIGMSLDRKNNDGDYEPNNCRWATAEIQLNNRRNNVNLTYNGITMSTANWARKLGITGEAMRLRLKNKYPEKELFAPGQHNRFKCGRKKLQSPKGAPVKGG